MEDLGTLKTDVLIDMLAKLTEQYTDKIAHMNIVVLSQYEYDIALLQAEINSRIKIEIPRSETERLLNKIKSLLPLWRRYLIKSRRSQRDRPKPGFT